jgi:hypothetical protein
MLSKHSSRPSKSVIKINSGPREPAGLVKRALATPDELAWARPP